MVATRGKGWVLAPSLVWLVDQLDHLHPNRSRIADGSIGDRAHSQRASDHNPSSGFVHAVDVTHNPPIFDAHQFAKDVASRADLRVKYVISDSRIWKNGSGWETYRGSNRHDHHTHISIHHDKQARNDTSTWFPASPGDDDMPTPQQQYAACQQIVSDLYEVAGVVPPPKDFGYWTSLFVLTTDPHKLAEDFRAKVKKK